MADERIGDRVNGAPGLRGGGVSLPDGGTYVGNLRHILAARRSDPRLAARVAAVRRTPTHRGAKFCRRRGSWPHLLLDALGVPPRHRPVGEQPAPRRRHRPLGDAISRGLRVARGHLEEIRLWLDCGGAHALAGHVAARHGAVCHDLESDTLGRARQTHAGPVAAGPETAGAWMGSCHHRDRMARCAGTPRRCSLRRRR